MRREEASRLIEELLGAIDAAIPERGAGIAAALSGRLEVGPWTLLLFSRATGNSAPPMSRDAFLHEIGRALASAHGDRADSLLLALERWLGESAFFQLEETLGAIQMGHEQTGALVSWAADALDAGHDSPSLRILAGESRDGRGVRRMLDLALAELSVPPIDEQACHRRLARRIAADHLCGQISGAVAVQRMRLLSGATDHREYGLWSRLHEELDDRFSPRNPAEAMAELRDALTQILAGADD